MVITILEAVVERDRIGELENAYRRETGAIPPEIVETFLARDAGDETKFRIITIWRDRQALESMRASVEKPKGVQIFEEAGAAPTLTILNVIAHLQGQPDVVNPG